MTNLPGNFFGHRFILLVLFQFFLYSGLDSSTTKQCVMLLKQLSQEGKTIICTIHQPSALIFELFDHLYALTEGRCIYQGSIKGMLPYFEEQGLRCPPYHNPADYRKYLNSQVIPN